MATTEQVAARITRAGLEGDGVASRLFELLWKRDLLSDSSLALRIPDTIIFKYNAPSLWYFTSVDGTIKRKCKAKVNNEYIAKEFLKRASPSGIAASYITTLPDSGPCIGGGPGEGSVGTRTTVEYLDREGLQAFLFDRQRVRSDGILQRFVEPKNGHNNMVRALWSPKVCLLERRVNHLRLSDSRYDIYERAVTFEGADCHSEVTPVRGPALVTKVHEIADSIVQHVAAVTNDRMKISRLALNFKVDDKDRLWLLFASSVRLRDELTRRESAGQADVLTRQGLSNTPLEAHTVLQVPDHVRRARTTSHACPVALQRTCRCPTCDERVEAGCLFDLSYKLLVDYGERQLAARQRASGAAEAEGDVAAAAAWEAEAEAAAEVPEALRKLHPRLTAEEYARCRHDVAFLYKAAAVCESCFLRFSRPQLGVASAFPAGGGDAKGAACVVVEDEAGAISVEVPLLGMQKLDPERLRLRRHATLQKICSRRAEEDEWWEEQAREKAQQARVKQWRAKSCPKLPSWSPRSAGPTLQPPAPVLANRPRPPEETAPLWSAVQCLRQPDPALEPPQRVRRRVPPLRGEPYLREVQAFAARCAGRAAEVLGPAAYEAAANAVSLLHPSPRAVAKAAKAAAKAANEQVQGVQQDLGARVDASGKGRRSCADQGHLQRDGDEPGLDLEAGEDSDGPDDVLEESEGDPIVAELWGKWPPSCGSRGGARSGTPTTRPPSQGEPALSGPSSYPCSRPSTRTSSRGKSPATASGVQQQQQQQQHAAARQRLRAGRPHSSPQVGRSAGMALDAAPQQRPNSSPGVNPGFRRAVSLRAAQGSSPHGADAGGTD
uniref:Uncharacterized protein n=1 Tax=Pyrodinium bahamense TaxID=73915 RepID=A0A7S0FQM9_9DINO|mmetsp:Transcript_42088/g.117188  ORF Transcript_42088/g.117188 Transcript_42088/m.117188 type:complete len:835 (+) Transcript_42088:148-2652(+)